MWINCDDKTMYFGTATSPGFNIPVEDGLAFEDYVLDFGENAFPRQELLSDDCFMLGRDETPLRGNRYLNLRHELFNNDALVLNSMPKHGESIASPKGKKGDYRRFSENELSGNLALAENEKLGVFALSRRVLSVRQSYCGDSGDSRKI